jgi:hydroxylamine reductase (hybrid-cluster protein)
MKWEKRLEAQMPQNKLASAGMMCTYCDLGPCAVNPFDEEPSSGACGIDAANMNYVNLGLHIVKGLADYNAADDLSPSLSLDTMVGPTHTAGIGVEDLLQASSKILTPSEEIVSGWHSARKTPREIEHGIGVLERDSVNLVLAAYEPDLIKVSRSQKYRNLARDNGAQGINLVGALCGGAEASYNHGIPLLGSADLVEEAADMIDYVYQGGDVIEACEKAVENFSKRDKAAFRHFTPKRYTVGYDIATDTINEAVSKGVIKGVVAFIGCESGKCMWDIDELVKELCENNFLVINLGCTLRGAEPSKGCAMMDQYSIPCVVNGGACEPGKVVGLHKLTVLMPRWREPRMLTAAFALASEKIPVILGTMPFVIPQVKNQLMNAGINVETDSTKVADLLGG